MSDNTDFPTWVNPATIPTKPIVTIDPRAIEVALMSAGKLSLPYRVHVRDFNMDDANRMAMATDETLIDVIMTVLQGVIQEDIDIGMIHEEEAKQILLTIFVNFWGTAIEQYPYELDVVEIETLRETDNEKYLQWLADKHEFYTKVVLIDPVTEKSSIRTTPLKEEFKEPFVIKDKNGGSFAFRLPRLGDLQKAQKKLDAVFATKDLEMYDVQEAMGRVAQLRNRLRDLQRESSADEVGLSELRSKIHQTQLSVDPIRKRAYDQHVRDRNLLFLGFKQALCIEAKDGVPIASDEERFMIYPEVSAKTWQDYQKIVSRYSFGVDGKMKVTSPLTGGLVDREIRFRIMDLIPSVDVGGDREPDVVFGSIC